MSKALKMFKQRNEELRKATYLERNTRQALTGNLPKRKIKEYEPVVTKAYVDKLNASQKAAAAFKKLSVVDKAIAVEGMS